MEPGKSYCKSQGNRTFVLDLFGSFLGILEMSSYDILFIYISIMQYIYIYYLRICCAYVYRHIVLYNIIFMQYVYIYIYAHVFMK